MRERTREVKIRMNEKEFEHLNKMVEKSIFNRSDFIRHLLNGYEIQEKPSVDDNIFRIDIRNIAGALNQMYHHNMFVKMNDEQIAEIMALVKRSHELEEALEAIYMPYYKIKGGFKIYD